MGSITHATPPDGSFTQEGAAAWQEGHSFSLSQSDITGLKTTDSPSFSRVTATGAGFQSTVSGAEANLVAVNAATNFPRAQFQIGNSTSDTNVGINVASLYSSNGTQIPAFINVSTDKTTTNNNAQQIALYVSTTKATIGTLARDGAGGGTPNTLSLAVGDFTGATKNGLIVNNDTDTTVTIGSDTVLTTAQLNVTPRTSTNPSIRAAGRVMVGSNTSVSGLSGIEGVFVKNTSTTGESSLIVNNDATNFLNYGILTVFGSSHAGGNLFGLARPNRVFICADGSSNVGMAVGTLVNQSLTLGTNNVARVTIAGGGGVTLADANNVAVGTTTGTKIGTATSQKVGFWNATPIVQPTTAVAAATFAANTSGIANDTATFDGYTIGQVVKALRNAGLLA